MTIIAPVAPHEALDESPVGRLLGTLAAYVADNAVAEGGGRLTTGLLAGLLAYRHNVPSMVAIDLACNDAFDERVKEASIELQALLEQAHAAQLAEEYGLVAS
ncbi:hypothetical protein [Nonomuraea sp. NPDC003804]|uniref:hypothetical protein n=1 Tax=Nonomuraea sp. NPDC003804 TaxID=3154547 RepID=UPI0033AFBC8E